MVNATQAIDEGNVAGNEITISTRADEGEVVVEVSDTGRGIDPDYIEMIFEPFFTTKPAGEGTGLGLSICKKIVGFLNGRIEVNSKPGFGATFSIHLPVYADAS